LSTIWQVSQLKKKQEAQQQLLRQKQRSDDAAMRLQGEIQRIKSQKVFSPKLFAFNLVSSS
jgi:hypothetical protein